MRVLSASSFPERMLPGPDLHDEAIWMSCNFGFFKKKKKLSSILTLQKFIELYRGYEGFR